MNKEGVVRADYKTKEVARAYANTRTRTRTHTHTHTHTSSLYSVHWNQILDVWPYKVLKNWGYTEQTFILEFDDRTYPLKTSQGRWMNAMIDFYIESILGDMVRHVDMYLLLLVIPIPLHVHMMVWNYFAELRNVCWVYFLFQTTPPVTHQELGGATALDEVVQIPHNRDNVDESK